MADKEALERLLERMANECSAPMDLWDEFSRGVLTLIAEREGLEAKLKAAHSAWLTSSEAFGREIETLRDLCEARSASLSKDMATLAERLDAAILGLNSLTGFGEDHAVDRARSALIEARAVICLSDAQREGLEREVERLKVDLSGQEADNDSYRAIANAECNRAEAAEAKLSALEEAVQDAVNARDDADHALPDHLREPLIRALAALSNQGKPSS